MMKDFKNKITEFHYKKTFDIGVFGLFILFFIPSVFYSIIIKLKNFFYKIGFLKEKKAKAKVICIGNLTTGGVGKTPILIEFCKYLSHKKKVASLSRGYGGKLKGVNVIKDYMGNVLSSDPNIIGDEVKLILENSTPDNNFAVITSPDRLKGADYANENLGAEIILMDDGFSNRKIKKDLTILLFDSEKFIGNGFLLPLGPLREPFYEAKRADIIIIVDKNSNNSNIKKCAEFLENKFKKPTFISSFEIDYFYNIKTGKTVKKEEIKDVFAFTGIGSPKQFYNYLLPFNLLNTKSYDDHYKYTEDDIKTILNKAKDAKYIITTEKDAVKIKNLIQDDTNILAMKLKPKLDIANILKNFNL